ncbi:hypothetical protein AGABI2DRAFT_210807 [Agaricus bisporus var. bisporus H97]|uniref:hypothetical protein n=1 Tax=Agaricus bisporus var. bisporus (strain H97 / ATCC MYA-4626 / FGSC 10389) TaxID=936046 RepID=UPI00029F54A4|nr:hypothetical protein AGABI2DRAFT_210807 [Agaricus bisporus var. bisporus H97]EKV43073.1 hypothetical protein AGABI2DRAFT_210807 [Agaricus bisporus var. bisporus H97]
MPPAFLPEDSRLISDLQAIEKKSPKLVRSSVYPAPGEPNILIRSWKMNEFKYYDIPSPFPTLARGLFTIEVPESEYGVKHRIVARGYDKFFNIGEVPWTTWEAIEANTAPPYALSLKSNGCIIFIAALTRKKLVVTSKHSIGPVDNAETSHAQAGEQWLRRYLEEKGRTEEEFAARLWQENWTAVAELCDDSFEEHVLAYPPERTGLHLHGLNVATKDFITMPHKVVDSFAEEWGFVKTRTHVVSSIEEVREFTSHIGEVGEWEGEAVEGFVVRTHVTDSRSSSDKAARGELPYAPGSSFFFKIKFDEPYMMYRDWREVTKKLLSTKGPLVAASLPKGKMKREETKVYVKWVIQEIQKNRKQFDGYTKGHGIIATRERFLEWYEKQKTSGKVEEGGDKTSVTPAHGKVIIVPVAIPGCGKTSVGVALTHLFKFGHTQSDDVTVKKAAPVFLRNVNDLLHKQTIVIADKNNHLRQHRQQLREIANKFDPPAHLIALNWSVTDKPPAIVHQICSDRIVDRGANHQTLTPTGSSRTHLKDVLWMFLRTHEALSEVEVDECIDMEVEDDLETMVRCAVDGLWKLIGGKDGLLGNAKPSEEKIKEALVYVKEYKAKKNNEASQQKRVFAEREQDKRPRYYGLLPVIELEETVNKVFANVSNANSNSGVQFWEKLKKAGRVVKQPHITIVHQKELPQAQSLWDLSQSVVASTPPSVFKIKFGNLLWDDNVMVLTIDNIERESGPDMNGENNLIDMIPDATKKRLHVTVGTANSEILAVEGMKLVQRWRGGEREKEGVFECEIGKEMDVTGKLEGLIS